MLKKRNLYLWLRPMLGSTAVLAGCPHPALGSMAVGLPALPSSGPDEQALKQTSVSPGYSQQCAVLCGTKCPSWSEVKYLLLQCHLFSVAAQFHGQKWVWGAQSQEDLSLQHNIINGLLKLNPRRTKTPQNDILNLFSFKSKNKLRCIKEYRTQVL